MASWRALFAPRFSTFVRPKPVAPNGRRSQLSLPDGAQKAFPAPARSSPGRGGFALVELMVVVTIISLLAMVALPALARVQRRTKSTAVMNDFRVFASAFDNYAQELGRWPPETGPGILPSGMRTRLKAAAWTRTTPMGGKYNWEYNQLHRGIRYRAAITIKATAAASLSVDWNQLADLDRAFDDGNLLTGNFQIGTGNVPLFIIQP